MDVQLTLVNRRSLCNTGHLPSYTNSCYTSYVGYKISISLYFPTIFERCNFILGHMPLPLKTMEIFKAVKLDGTPVYRVIPLKSFYLS